MPSTCWSTSKIDRIEQEFEEFIVAHRSEEAFKKSLDECDCSMGFKDVWSYTGGRFPVLQYFCGGLATVFPGTAMAYSDFSIVKYVNNEYQNLLKDFSLEGILHENKFRLLQAIDTK